MTSVVAGFDGSAHAQDAVILGEALAVTMDADLVVACVHPLKPRTSAIGEAGFDREVRAGAQRTAESARSLLARPGEATFTAVLGISAAAGLADLARDSHAAAIAVGSSRRGPIGRVLLGSVGRELLPLASCLVAIAPAAYRQGAGAWSHIGAAFDGSPASEAAVHVAESVAARMRARLQVVGVGEELRPQLDEIVAAAPVSVRAKAILRGGDPVEQLALASEDLDALVCGSRGRGRVRRLVLGSVSAGLMQRAKCPLLVTPAA